MASGADNGLDRSIFRYVIRFSIKDTLTICGLVAAAQLFYYITLDLPKNIMNQGIQGKNVKFPVDIAGLGWFSADQLGYLMWLCLLFFVAILINGALKQYVNSLKGKLGERLLRRLRFQLMARILRFPVPHFRKTSSGELIPMLTAEVEQIGGFMGDAFVQPLMQFGMLLTIAIFLFVQNPLMGLAAISLFPLQAYIVPKLQKRVKALGKERVKAVRKISERIGETVGGIQEVRTLGTAAWERADYTERFGLVYRIRFDIYQRKSLVKFINNTLNQCAPLLFYGIGGYLVIQGSLTLGALVAALAAHKDMTAPWKELLDYYQQAQDAQQKYEQVIEQFQPENMLPEGLHAPANAEAPRLDGPMAVTALTVQEDAQTKLLEGVTFAVSPGEHIAVVGPPAGGREAIAMTLARLYLPTGGSIRIGGVDLAAIADADLGVRMGYVGPNAYIFSASVRENLLYGLRQRVLSPTEDAARRAMLVEAEKSGNLALDIEAQWVDYAQAGAKDAADFDRVAAELLTRVDLAEDVFQLGLRGRIDPKKKKSVAEAILAARAAFRQRLSGAQADPALKGLVETFDPDRYNDNATLGENLLFGTPLDPSFDGDALSTQPDFLAVLRANALDTELVAMGRNLAETMIELFAGLPAGHEFFDRFSFIAADDLPVYQAILSRTVPLPDGTLPGMDADDRARLLSLPLKLVDARHRLGLIDKEFKARALATRKALQAGLPAAARAKIAFFDPERYNAAASIQDNILFGRVAYGQAKAQATVGQSIREVLDTLALRERVFEIGLDFQTGVAGARLSAPQRQKLAIARALAKRPDLLVMNDAIAALDRSAQARVLDAVLAASRGTTLVWATQDAAAVPHFARALVFAEGRLIQDGPVEDLKAREGMLKEMLAAE
ncbi:MAG: ATP-binding cassette domain-containing protein [Proteobacteria bacterium]|nr:ATP-binding cassette domain-containing protein [Pseudomonadota bacterium]